MISNLNRFCSFSCLINLRFYWLDLSCRSSKRRKTSLIKTKLRFFAIVVQIELKNDLLSCFQTRRFMEGKNCFSCEEKAGKVSNMVNFLLWFACLALLGISVNKTVVVLLWKMNFDKKIKSSYLKMIRVSNTQQFSGEIVVLLINLVNNKRNDFLL